MILAVDVDYRGNRAYIGGVTFEHWIDNHEKETFISFLDKVNDYIPGQFYLRELPCILRLIEEHKLKPEYVVIDGFVFLDGESKPGLGKYLYDALNQKVAVIGVALDDTKTFIRSMHGDYRVPTLLKRVDQLCRQKKWAGDE